MAFCVFSSYWHVNCGKNMGEMGKDDVLVKSLSRRRARSKSKTGKDREGAFFTFTSIFT